MESANMNGNEAKWFTPYANIRGDCYVMLASLLNRAPSDELIELLQNLTWDSVIPRNLDEALAALNGAGSNFPTAAAADEFNRLFVGLGCGEMVPYASWYREKRIQSLPLAELRSDLSKLGIVRQTASHESEDHAGALCEIMAILIQKQDAVPRETQAEFFQKHLYPWMVSFFRDLQSAKSTGFYRTVARFGICFLELENDYLRYRENNQVFPKEGGSCDEKRSLRQQTDISENGGVF
jgi:TorA maturation chaperone TorD